MIRALKTVSLAVCAAVALLFAAPPSAEANPFKGLGHAIKDGAKAGGRAIKNGARSLKGGKGARSGAKAGGKHHGGKSHGGGRHHHRR